MQLVRLTAQHLAGRGIDLADFRQIVGINDLELSRNESRLDLHRWQLARRLVEQTGRIEDLDEEPAAGRIGWVAHSWPEVASLLFNSPSLGAALQAYARYRPLIGNVDEISCQGDKDHLVLRLTPHASTETCVLSTMSHLLMVRDVLAYYGERSTLPISMHVEIGDVGRPLSRTRALDLLQSPLYVDMSTRTHSVKFGGPGLWEQVEGHHKILQGWALNASEDRLHALAAGSAEDPLVSRIGLLIQRTWAATASDQDALGLPSALLQVVARDLGMSRWTLRRQLTSSGLVFADLVEALRAEQLPSLLSEPGLSLMEVGGRLGFTSQSAFSRYFRNRYGHSPSKSPIWREREALCAPNC